MREPKIDGPSSEETSDILAATGKTQNEVEELIRASISKGEYMARLGRDYIGEVKKKAEDAWVARWNDDDVLVMWFGRVDGEPRRRRPSEDRRRLRSARLARAHDSRTQGSTAGL